MIDPSLATAVEQFALQVIELPDAAMERDWSWQDREADVRWGLFRAYEALRDLAVVTAMQRHKQGRSPSTAQRALAPYQSAYRDLQALLLGVADEEIDRAPAEGEWSLRAVLTHMMRTEQGFLAITAHALKRYRTGEPPQPIAEEEVLPDRRSDGDQRTLLQIRASYEALHNQVLHELLGISEVEQQAEIRFWYDADVRFQLYRFDAHLREHTIQVEKVLEAIRHRPLDSMRTIRLIYAALADAEAAAFGSPESAADRRRSVAASLNTLAAELSTAATA